MSTEQTSAPESQEVPFDIQTVATQIQELLATIDGDLGEIFEASDAVDAARKAYIEAQVNRYKVVCKKIEQAIEDEKAGKKSRFIQQQADKEATLKFIKDMDISQLLPEVLQDVEFQVTALYVPGQLAEPTEAVLGRPDGGQAGLDALGLGALLSQAHFTKHSTLSDVEKLKRVKSLIDCHLAFCLVDAIRPATAAAAFLQQLPTEKAVEIHQKTLRSPQTAGNSSLVAKTLSTQFNQTAKLVLAELGIDTSEDSEGDSETDSE